ncbi:MAG: TIM barrel protein [Xylophilus ampelinus]
MPRLLGISPLTHLELSPPGMVANAAAAGYDALGLRLVPATPQEPRHDSQGDTPLVRETAQRLRDTGLQVLDIEVFRLQPGTRVADCEAALEAGAILGARHVLAAPQDADTRRLGDRLGALCELAAGYGLMVDLEPTPWYEVPTLGAAAAAIAASGRRDVGLVVDPIHWDRAGDTVESVRALDPAFFRYMQLCDAPAARPGDLPTLLLQARAERLMPGDGGLDLAGLLRAMPPRIPISLEIPMHNLAASVPALERARTMLGKARALLDSLD